MRRLELTMIYIVGFPRNKEQCDYFEHLIGPISLLVVLDCPESIMIERLTRSDRSRFDDNLDNIKRRIETFHKTTCQVIDSFKSLGRAAYVVDSNQGVDSVRLQVETLLMKQANVVRWLTPIGTTSTDGTD
jgi:UMP-CMP kinase